jgi:histidinol-phosphate aminotransferase
VNAIAQKAAVAAIQDQAHIKASIENNSMQKQFLQSEFARLGLESLGSEGNFIAVKVPIPGRDMFNKLMKEGVIVRPIDLYGMPDFIRVTIGSPEENKFFIEIIEKILN